MKAEDIKKMLACFYGNYRSYLQNKNKMTESELDFHLAKYSNRFSIIVQLISANTLKFQL